MTHHPYCESATHLEAQPNPPAQDSIYNVTWHASDRSKPASVVSNNWPKWKKDSKARFICQDLKMAKEKPERHFILIQVVLGI
jgi:hypothetical protein